MDLQCNVADSYRLDYDFWLDILHLFRTFQDKGRRISDCYMLRFEDIHYLWHIRVDKLEGIQYNQGRKSTLLDR